MKVVTGVILGWVVLALAALLFVYSGVYNVAASKPENAITAWLFSTTMRRSVARHADPAVAPGQSTDDQVRQGFKLYNETCVYCHGAPGKDPVDIGKGLNPEPPYLADTVDRWTTPELFWIVKNGVRMTGMPSFGGTHSDADLAACVAFIQRLPKMTPEQYTEFEKQ
jgi:mono/diheme cytochrome c family protein